MNLYASKISIKWAMFFLLYVLSLTSLGSAVGGAEDPREILSRTVAYKFKDPALLELALTHHSSDLGGSVSTRGNERLEFLGDAVLDCVMKMQVLERSYGPQLANLNDNTALLTQNRVLVRVADAIGLPPSTVLPAALGTGVFIKAGKLSALEDAKADLVEALMGAIYLDSGDITPVEVLVKRFWFSAEAPENYCDTVLRPSSEMEVTTAKMGYRFKTPWYLSASLGQAVPMEALGKSLLKFVVNEFLYRRFPELPEGELAKRSNALHAKRNIASLPFLGANAQAFIGGIYLDGGLSIVRQFILWHWTSPDAPEEIRAAIYKAPNTVPSDSFVVYPAGVKAVIPKTFLLEVLKPLAQTPRFDTKEVSSTPASKFISKVVLEEDGKVISKEVEASTKKDAEKAAALEALEGLGVRALVDLDMVSPALLLVDSYLRVLEGFLIVKGMSFEYHQLAAHPSGKGLRLEVQGRDLESVIVEAPSRMEAQYHALAYSILQRLESEFTSFRTSPPEHRLALNDWMLFYKRYMEEAMQKAGGPFEVIPRAKAKEKKTPSLTYQLNVPARSLSIEGIGYSVDEAILDALTQAFKAIKTLSASAAGGAGEY